MKINFETVWDFIGIKRKSISTANVPAKNPEQEDEFTVLVKQGPKLSGKAAEVLESLRPFLRPEDVTNLFKVDAIGTRKLSGRGGDVVSGQDGETVIIDFNSSTFGKNHPILWAALLVKELSTTNNLVEGFPVGNGPSRGRSKAVAFLNELPNRMSLSFLEAEIAKEAKKKVR